MDSQPLATLVDIGLRGCEDLEMRLTSRVELFADRWLAQDAFNASKDLLFEWQVDNFGVFGTALLLAKTGVNKPIAGEAGVVDFEERALARVGQEEGTRSEDWRDQRFFFKERVYCYTEFALRHPTATESEKLSGTMVKENSFLGEGTRAGKTGLLRSTTLPINELVDRTLCAEFQTLSQLCDIVDGVGVTG